MRARILLAIGCLGAAFACSRSELFGFDEGDLSGLSDDAGTLLDADSETDGPDASTNPALVKALNCPQPVRDVCGDSMYQPGAPWPTSQRCSSHASRTTAIGPTNPTTLWSRWVDLSETVFGPVTITANGEIYVSPFGGVTAFASDGTFLFNAGPNGYGVPLAGGPILGGPNAYGTSPVAIGPDGTAYTADDAVYAVNPDGSQRWTSASLDVYKTVTAYGVDGTSGSAVTLGPCGIVDVSTPIAMFSYDPNTGQQLWRHSDIVTSVAAVDSAGNIFYENLANQLVALASDGSLRWSFTPADAPTKPLPWIEAAPVIGPDGTLYFSEVSGLYAVSKAGTLEWEVSWTYDASAGASYLAIALGADGTLYAIAPDSSLRAVSSDGVEKWSLAIGANGTAPVVDGAGTIYELGEYGLYSITPGGVVSWIYPLFFAPLGGLAMGADGTLYVSAFGVFAIGNQP